MVFAVLAVFPSRVKVELDANNAIEVSDIDEADDESEVG